MKPMDVNGITTDTFFHGKLIVAQHQEGYRFSIDAVLLSHYAEPNPNARVLDLGTGCGIVALILAYRFPSIEIFGVELQSELARMAEFNVHQNEMQARINIIQADLTKPYIANLPGLFDMVVCNPPFRKSNSGRINPNRQKALARHEITVTLSDILGAAERFLRPKGCFVAVYTAERLMDLLASMRKAGIEPKRMRMIHSRANSAGNLVLMKGSKGGRPGLKVGPPMIIYNEDGSYTTELVQMFDA
jgi:tRNA1Val (adenine37-N6)-methyltransferase